MSKKYLFMSERLGFRNWLDTDVELMARINADTEVMAFFPGTHTLEQTRAFIERMKKQMADKGYCYYAVDELEAGEFVGFIGLSDQTFEASFTPCVDIGWRLSKNKWNRGYATEGAFSCFAYAFSVLDLACVNAMAPNINLRSVRVMKKTGMKKVSDFIHPLLNDDERLKNCVLYERTRKEHKNERH
jgi:RimJ/RimL family protein N-acetyltransferase